MVVVAIAQEIESPELVDPYVSVMPELTSDRHSPVISPGTPFSR